MLNGSNLGELDLSTIDLRAVTHEQREAVMREAIRQAHAGRSRMLSNLIGWLRSRSRQEPWRTRAATLATSKSNRLRH